MRIDGQLNPYDEDQCKKVVSTVMDKLLQKFGSTAILNYDRVFPLFSDTNHSKGFPLDNLYRQVLKTSDCSPRTPLIVNILPLTSYYYVGYLLELNPSTVLDMGCGTNFFKGVVPNIHGVDSSSNIYVDEVSEFNKEYIQNNLGKFDCAMSINALHFIPIDQFAKRILDFSTVIKKGGRGYVAMNSIRLIQFSPVTVLHQIFNTANPNVDQIKNYINTELQKLDLEFLVIDNIIDSCPNESLDGNIRLVFQV